MSRGSRRRQMNNKLGRARSKKKVSTEKNAIKSGTVYDKMFQRERRQVKATGTLPLVVKRSNKPKSPPKPHSYIYTMLNSKSRQHQAAVFKKVMTFIILTDVAFFVVSTEPNLQDNRIFYIEEGIVSSLFLLEYIMRLVWITESRKYEPSGPFWGRVKYAFSLHAVIDAFATFPFFLELIFKDTNLPTFTYLRFFRLMRILRTDGLGRAIDSLRRVLYYNREILYVAGVMAGGLIFFTAVLMYYLRPIGGDLEDPSLEWSLTTTMYYSTLLLTGQGGPEGDLPWYTKTVVLLTGLFSIGMCAIPASMLTGGFEAEAARGAAKTRKRHVRASKGEPTYSSTSSSSSDDLDDSDSSCSTSDEEYMKLIAGEDEGDEGGDGGDNAALQESLNDILSAVSGQKTENSQEILERINKLEEKVDQILNILAESKNADES